LVLGKTIDNQRVQDFMTDQIEDAAIVQQRLRDSEARLRLLTQASTDVLYRMSPDWGEMKELDGGGFLPSTASSMNRPGFVGGSNSSHEGF
jgi:hypothetical protein